MKFKFRSYVVLGKPNIPALWSFRCVWEWKGHMRTFELLLYRP